ncbi:MAG TPA: CBS domain-containing protein, partial [Oculatellaceae cyanobacterium]
MSQNLSDTQTLLDQAIDRHPLMVPAETTVSDAIATMSQTRASYTLIVEHQKLLGIFTERDVVKIAASQMPLEGVTISQVMTQNLITLSIAEAGNIFDLLALLRS